MVTLNPSLASSIYAQGAARTAAGAVNSAATATSGSIFSKALNFLAGAWAAPVGKDLHAARKAGTATFTSFNYKGAYQKFFANQEIEAAKAAAKAATEPAKKGLFAGIKNLISKIPGGSFVVKNPVAGFIIISGLWAAYDGYKKGGAIEAGKSVARSAAGLAGMAIATVAAAGIGITGGIPLFIAGMAGSFAADWLAKKVAPPIEATQSETEQQTQEQIQQAQNKKNSSYISGDARKYQENIYKIYAERDEYSRPLPLSSLFPEYA